MSPTVIIVIVVVVVVVLALVGFLVQAQRRRHLRERFGPEYDRTVADSSSRREAERELADREKRHSKLDIRPLPEETRQRYLAQWKDTQGRFVDEPQEAIGSADRLLTQVMAERGYPTDGGYEQQLNDLSVEHARTLDHYRTARDTLHGDGADTEQLRQALVNYRAVFHDLLGGDEPKDEGKRVPVQADRHTAEDVREPVAEKAKDARVNGRETAVAHHHLDEGNR